MTNKATGEGVVVDAPFLSSIDVVQLAKRYREFCSVPETRKKLLRIFEKNNDDWVEVSGEVYDYFEERVFIENNIEANRRLKEQFMSN